MIRTQRRLNSDAAVVQGSFVAVLSSELVIFRDDFPWSADSLVRTKVMLNKKHADKAVRAPLVAGSRLDSQARCLRYVASAFEHGYDVDGF